MNRHIRTRHNHLRRPRGRVWDVEAVPRGPGDAGVNEPEARLLHELHVTVDPKGPWGHHLADAGTALRYHADLMALAPRGIGGMFAVDAGCGDGFNAHLLTVLGAGRVAGFDVDPSRIQTAHAALAGLPAERAGSLELRVGDVTALPLPDASVDVLLSNEAAGVYLDLDAFLVEAARVVRPGGATVIAESNGAINPLLRRKSLDLWEAYERGPAPRTVHGHRIEYPYVEERADIVRALLPSAGPGVVRRIAENTSGMDAGAVKLACRHYSATGALPAQPYQRGQIPVTPSGMVVERPVDPYALARRLNLHGFETRVRGYWGGARGGRAVRLVDRLLASTGRILVWTAPAFRVIGVRREA